MPERAPWLASLNDLAGPYGSPALLLAALLLTGWLYRRQRQATQALREATAQAAQAEATLRHLPLATLVLDDAMRVVQANPAAEHLLAAPAEVWSGKPIAAILPEWPASGGGDLPERI